MISIFAWHPENFFNNNCISNASETWTKLNVPANRYRSFNYQWIWSISNSNEFFNPCSLTKSVQVYFKVSSPVPENFLPLIWTVTSYLNCRSLSVSMHSYSALGKASFSCITGPFCSGVSFLAGFFLVSNWSRLKSQLVLSGPRLSLLLFWNWMKDLRASSAAAHLANFFDRPTPKYACPSTSTDILKVGAWDGPCCSITTYLRPERSSFRTETGFCSLQSSAGRTRVERLTLG